MTGDSNGERAHGAPLGSAAEEAAKLFGAVGDWAKQHSGEAATDLAAAVSTGLAGLAAMADHARRAAADLGRDVEEHVDTGAPECTYCPICRTMHVVREASPEVMAHLATAATSLVQAAAAVAAAASSSGSASRRAATVEKIDLDPEHGQSQDWPHESGKEQENQE